jgi:hypothetical protein
VTGDPGNGLPNGEQASVGTAIVYYYSTSRKLGTRSVRKHELEIVQEENSEIAVHWQAVACEATPLLPHSESS